MNDENAKEMINQLAAITLTLAAISKNLNSIVKVCSIVLEEKVSAAERGARAPSVRESSEQGGA